MPYGFYQFVRLIGLVGFTILAYKAKEGNRQLELIIYVGLAILFQPIFKIAFDRQTWNNIDVIVGLLLLLSILFNIVRKV